MYFIIGGDGKQYGPITDADIRQWIAEGRLNGQSMAKAEGDAEFRPLSAFPQFAGAFGAGAPGIPPFPTGAPEDRQSALQKVKVPAIGLIVTSIINILLSVWGAVKLIVGGQATVQQINDEMAQMNNPQMQQFMHQFVHMMGPVAMGTQFFQLLMAVLILFGAMKMKSLKSHQFAMTVAILSVIPCCTDCWAYPFSLVFGIWAIVVLFKPDVKSRFV